MDTTRRSFLGGLAVASALTSATVAQSAPSTPENPELLRLGEQFEAANARFLAADEALSAPQAAYLAQAPSGEGVTFTRVPYDLRHVAQVFTDPTCPNYRKWRNSDGDCLYVVDPYYLDREILGGGITATRGIKRLRKLAAQFHADVETARKASGLDDAMTARYWAADALRSIISEMSRQRAHSLQGVAIKVRATAAYAALGENERLHASQWLANAIWDDLGEEA